MTKNVVLCHINTFMKTTYYDLNKTFSEHLASRFSKRAVNFVFFIREELPVFSSNHEIYIGKDYINEEKVDHLVKRIRNKLSRNFFGKASERFDKKVTMSVALHKSPDWHIHGILDVPEYKPISDVKMLVEQYCQECKWIRPKNNKICYFSEVKSVIGSHIYNNRNGLDSVILF